MATPYLPELESLRGLAMLMVLLFHLDGLIQGRYLHVGGEIVSPLLAYVRAGHAGVDLFFVLSAFLLSLPFLAQTGGGKPVSVRRYCRRRALRILPLYYAAVFAAAVLAATAPSEVLRGLPYLLFLDGFAGLTTPLPPYSNVWWSLATEVQFYLVLPLLPLALGSRRGRIGATLVLITWVALYAAFVTRTLPLLETAGEFVFGLSLLGRAPLFLAGIAAARLYLNHGEALRRRLGESALLHSGAADILLVSVLVALGFMLREVVWIGANLAKAPAFHAWHVIEALLWAVVLLLLLLAPLRLKTLFSNPLLNRLGVLSYSVYILHVPVIFWSLQFLRSRWPSVEGWNARTAIVASLLCALCIGLAELTYRGIERPFLRRKERLPA